MLSRGVISRHPSRRLSARDAITLREPIRKVWSIFHTILQLGLKIVGLVETANGDGDTIARNAPIRKWRTALTAKVARDGCRRQEGAGLPARPYEVGARHTGKRLEVIARCLLAHAALADAGLRWLGEKGVPHCATLASTAPHGLVQISHEHSPSD